MRKRIDHVAIGFVLGLLMPLIGWYFYYLFTYRYQTSFAGFFDYYKRLQVVVASLSVTCYITNLPLFFLFIWRNMLKAARGVLGATIVYTLWVIYEKFLA